MDVRFECLTGRRVLRRGQLRLGDVGSAWRALLLGAPPVLF